MNTIFTHLACIGEVPEKCPLMIQLPHCISDCIQRDLRSCETENPGVRITFNKEVRMYVHFHNWDVMASYSTNTLILVFHDYALELYSK